MALEDNQKIGIGLICLGMLFLTLGVLLFFDAAYELLIIERYIQ